MTLAPGTRLGPYEIVGLLGTGGMGEVYRAKDLRLGREVAIFSFGVVLYEIATGRAAFGEATTAAVFNAILNREPTDPLRLNPRIPEDLGRIIRKAMDKDPDLRYQHAADLRSDLKRLQRDAHAGRKEMPGAEEAHTVIRAASRAETASDSQLVAAVLKRHPGAVIAGIAGVAVLCWRHCMGECTSYGEREHGTAAAN